MGERLQLLLIDDEQIVLKRLKPALEKDGYEVDTCDDGERALELVDERRYDIVVTDVRMAGVDGIRVLEYVLSKKKDTKVILITGYATVEVAREALAKGAFDFIAKPFKPNDLREIIEKASRDLRK